MLMKRFLLALALGLSACGDESFFASISAGSAPNQCSRGDARSTITSVEISESDAYGDTQRPFTAIESGSTVRIVRGLQGADMLVLSIRVNGLSAPACLVHRTDITDATGARVTTVAQPIMFSPTGGVATNERMFFPGEFRSGTFTITATVAGVSVTRTVQAVRS
jgi:hypothetical protein